MTRNASSLPAKHPSYHTLHIALAARFVPLFHVNRIVVFTMFLESNRKIGVEKLIPIVKLFLMSIRDIFEMLNSRIQGKGIHFVHCSGRSAGVASVASCDRTLRIQSEDLPLTVKAKKNCRSVIAKLFEENPL